MKNKMILLSALVLISLGTAAQSKKEAEDILDKVTEQTKSYTSIKIDFTYNMDNPEAKIHESEKGSLLVKNEKYRLNIAGQVVICDGSTVWTYLPDANEVQVNTVEDDEDIITPNRLLTSYTENYKSRLLGEEKKGSAVYQTIELKPTESKSYSNVVLTIDKNLLRIMKIAIQDNSGNTFTYLVDEFKPNVLFKVSDFVFDPADYPGVEVIDMR